MLFGCIHSPDFPVQAAIRHYGPAIFKSSPVVIVDGPDSRQKVFACNDVARDKGIAIGMTKAQLQFLPGVVIRRRRSEDETAAQAVLLDCGYAVSPKVESTCPGAVIADLSGAERLLGSPLAISRRFIHLAAQCNLRVRVAIAANPDAALHAARGFEGITVIAEGKEASTLAPLPVEILNPDPEALETLLNWGITDFKSLANLPARSLVQRLGQRGLYLQRLARGRIKRDLVPSPPVTQFQESIELEESVELLEPLSFIFNRLLDQLLARVRARSLGTDHIRVTLGLELHAERQLRSPSARPKELPKIHERTVKLPVPTQDARVFLKLLQLDLAAHPPMAPVKKITLEAFPAHLRFNQGGLFHPSAPEPARLEITIARLRAVVGEHDENGRLLVGFPVVKDSHKPDSFDVVHSGAFTREGHTSHREKLKLALRVFRPPVKVKVELASDEPKSVIIHGKRKRVLRVSGRWSNNGAWWNGAEEWSREEWDLELGPKHNASFRAFLDHQSGSWFLAGRYD
jgi:protein ImuB